MVLQQRSSGPFVLVALLAGVQLLGTAVAQAPMEGATGMEVTNTTNPSSRVPTNITNAVAANSANTSSTRNSSSAPGAALPGLDPAAEADLSSIPEACSTGGQDLQTFCADTINAAQAYFNVPADAVATRAPTVNITEEQVQAYIEQAAAPSPECCKAACEFNANYCNCEQGVLQFAVQLTGNNPNIFRSIAEGFERSCFYRLMYGPTCPSPAERASRPQEVCAAVTPVPAKSRPKPANSTATGSTPPAVSAVP